MEKLSKDVGTVFGCLALWGDEAAKRYQYARKDRALIGPVFSSVGQAVEYGQKKGWPVELPSAGPSE